LESSFTSPVFIQAFPPLGEQLLTFSHGGIRPFDAQASPFHQLTQLMISRPVVGVHAVRLAAGE
jgi:hypothetical protein